MAPHGHGSSKSKEKRDGWIALSAGHGWGAAALDHLLAIPRLQILQWTPGAGAASPADALWWPYFHKTVEAGKRVFIGVTDIAQLRALKNEFREKLNSFMIGMGAASEREGQEILELVNGS